MAFLLQCAGTSFASAGKVSEVIMASVFASPGGAWPGDMTACRVPPPLSSKVAKLVVPLASTDSCFSPTFLFLSVVLPASPQARLFIPPLRSWTLGQNAASSLWWPKLLIAHQVLPGRKHLEAAALEICVTRSPLILQLQLGCLFLLFPAQGSLYSNWLQLWIFDDFNSHSAQKRPPPAPGVVNWPSIWMLRMTAWFVVIIAGMAVVEMQLPAATRSSTPILLTKHISKQATKLDMRNRHGLK